jgi:hypothetical protein
MKYLLGIILIIVIFSCGDSEVVIQEYKPLSQFVEHGFMIENKLDDNKSIKIWGYFDIDNVSVEKNVFEDNLFPNRQGNYISLFAKEDDNGGNSIKVFLQNDINQYKKLLLKLSNFKTKRVKISINGLVRIRKASLINSTVYLINMYVNSIDDIKILD